MDRRSDNTVEQIVQNYLTTVTVVIKRYTEEQQQQQRLIAVLQLCSNFGVTSHASLLSLEALDIFDVLLSLYSTNWKAGSLPGKAPNIDRGREDAHRRLVEDYFCADPTYPTRKFRRRFRMRRQLFLRIVDRVTQVDSYFLQKRDATGKLGATPLQKVTAATRMLAYGTSADQLDEWIRLGESTIFKCFYRFLVAVYDAFGDEYLRAPTKEDMIRMLRENAKRGFPGMLGSIDCWHWEWKNCPSAWAGQFKGHKGKGCVTEACCGHDLWIWHLFCGNPGSLNDINILDRSPLLHQIYNQSQPEVKFKVNGNVYKYPYWLADGIYPRLATFVIGFSCPAHPVDKNFTLWQESIRKDIERAFGVLQARWRIIAQPARHWDREILDDVVKCCVILHNMIVEDEREDTNDNQYDDFDGNIVEPTYDITVGSRRDPALISFSNMLQRISQVQNPAIHLSLRNDLKQHLYANHRHYKSYPR
jgi:hypothetical protein